MCVVSFGCALRVKSKMKISRVSLMSWFIYNVSYMGFKINY